MKHFLSFLLLLGAAMVIVCLPTSWLPASPQPQPPQAANNCVLSVGGYVVCPSGGSEQVLVAPGGSSLPLFTASPTFQQLTLSGLGSSTNPICPNGTGGALTLTGCATGSAPAGTICQPLINTNGSTGYGTSAIFCDASQLSGTLDARLNGANAYAITTQNGVIDARSLGSGTISNEVEIGELLAPTLTPVTATSPGVGTYKLVYTLVSPSVSETTASMESSVTVTGSQGIQVSSPTVYGTATTYNVYMTAAGGSSWTEQKCPAATGITIGTPVTISAICSGASVSLSNQTGAVSLIPPKTGKWTVNITDGASCGIKFHDQSSFLGDSAGEGRPWALQAASTFNGSALWCTDNNGKSGAGYYNIVGISAADVAGDTVGNGVCYVLNTNDVSVFEKLHCGANTNVNAMLVAGACCGTRIEGSFEGNTLGTPITIGGASSLNSAIKIEGAFAHPKAGNPAMAFATATYTVELPQVYIEGSQSGSCADYIQIGTAGNILGPLKFGSVTVNNSVSGYCQGQDSGGSGPYLFSILNGSHTIGSIEADVLHMGNLTNIVKINGTGVLPVLGSANLAFPGFFWDPTYSKLALTGIAPPINALAKS